MAYDIGFNFRATSSFVSDGANQAFVLAQNQGAYPLTSTAFASAFGWDIPSSGMDCRDRAGASSDARTAGINFMTLGTITTRVFRIDIPSTGPSAVHWGFGDPSAGCGGIVKLYDGDVGGTTLITQDQGSFGIGSAHVMDATGTAYTDAAWPGSETASTVTITQTHVSLQLTNTYQGGGSQPTIQNIRLVSTGSGISNVPKAIQHYRQGD